MQGVLLFYVYTQFFQDMKNYAKKKNFTVTEINYQFISLRWENGVKINWVWNKEINILFTIVIHD